MFSAQCLSVIFLLGICAIPNIDGLICVSSRKFIPSTYCDSAAYYCCGPKNTTCCSKPTPTTYAPDLNNSDVLSSTDSHLRTSYNPFEDILQNSQHSLNVTIKRPDDFRSSQLWTTPDPYEDLLKDFNLSLENVTVKVPDDFDIPKDHHYVRPHHIGGGGGTIFLGYMIRRYWCRKREDEEGVALAEGDYGMQSEDNLSSVVVDPQHTTAVVPQNAETPAVNGDVDVEERANVLIAVAVDPPIYRAPTSPDTLRKIIL